jgi:exopolyphosphatase/guanosine-5'-triphosphate,3'-diphosphate pyrophosphatase
MTCGLQTGTMRAVRLAAVDLGSNSVHMVVADVSPNGHIQVVDRVKEMVRLGRGVFTTGRLSATAMDLAAHALSTFQRLARARRVERMAVVATSAVREARNGAEFVQRLRRETGLRVRVVSGAEEARLIFRAARHALGLEGGPHLLVDVGGGSVELVLVQDGRPLWLRSLPLGVARLTERFLPGDPPSAGQVRRLEGHLERVLDDLLDDARHAGVHRVIGTSGTVNTLIHMAHAARGAEPVRLHGTSASAGDIRRLARRLLARDAVQRAALPGADGKRIDLLPAAGVLLDHILRHTGAEELVACTWALREGLLLELARSPGGRAQPRRQVRRRSVEALAAKFAGDNAHGRQVARLTDRLFDATAAALGLPAGARELLEYAALVHDIGHSIDHGRHHRHSYYLINSAELLGFAPSEIEVIAQVVRGHRKQVPKPSDPELRDLPAKSRRMVRPMAALLRLADALDRTRFGVVKDVHPVLSGNRLTIGVDPGADDAELELWAAARRAELLARLLDRQVELRLVRSATPGALTASASAGRRS